ncbi:hypothetical protein LEP1GSC021_2439 [Leptospira noguchii str. 1993005606]|nr:hypothetical protein LEP1GSC021_2439 [Leptospira noguchii str. 1993005606]
MIYFSEKNWNLNFADRFLKCGNYCKSLFYEQILRTHTFKRFFLIF